MAPAVKDFVDDLDAPLLRISRAGDVLNTRSAASVHFWGIMGSGKTSSAQMLAGAQLRAGFGFYVTAAKPEVIPQWKLATLNHGRSKSLILFDEHEGFNFLDYCMARYGMDGIGTTVACLDTVIAASRRVNPTASQHGGEPIWDDGKRLVLMNGLPVLYAANGKLTIPDIIRFVSSAPTTIQDVKNRDWQQRSYLFQTLKTALEHPKVPISPTVLKNAVEFWSQRWLTIPSKTSGNILITVTAALDRFNHGRLNRVFCNKTTIVPEMSLHGAVIVDAKPTLTWNEDGVIAQLLFKFLWQKAVLNRNSLEETHRERPVGLWSDEAQETVAPYDGEFLGLARESKCCVTYLTQSLPTYFSKIGGDNPRDAALALAGKFKNHIFCANSCPETNEFASRMIGKVLTRRYNQSSGHSSNVSFGMSSGSSENSGSSSNSGSSYGSSGGGHSNSNSNSGYGHSEGTGSNWGSNRSRGTSQTESRGYSESMEYAIEPGDFGRILKTGGPCNNNRVTAVWFQSSHLFKASGTNHFIAEFKQQ